ncbi:unnamed protein product [Prorocentrum cordatum]|uniref:Myosin motor domain-containing protein n=1 Tax=Prorocentrum cordatum TaxID=2364126 RepID=A0ABN9X0K5_9DINO|nr:unnamed protein product [Polarella glacialis]
MRRGFEVLVEGLLGSGLQLSEVVDCCRVAAVVGLLVDTAGGGGRLAAAAALLRVAEADLRGFLTRAQMSVGAGGKEQLVRERGATEAATLQASLAQELYSALFGWLTRLVARGIAPPSLSGNGQGASEPGGCQLGLLDLYGFEVFAVNGFEQLLINYCNERLQQLFNRQVFAREAEEYVAEGIDADGRMACLTAACRLPALALLEGEPGGGMGVFGIVNDRSRCSFEESVSSGADGRGGCPLAETVATSHGGHPAFCGAGKGASRAFGVRHFAGEVIYEAAQFVRKNASAHRPDIVAFLRGSGCPFVRGVFAGSAEAAADGGASSSSTGYAPQPRRKLFGKTIISSFQQELNELCTALETRQCRHVRCLRPNDSQSPLVFDDGSMLRQCRYSGLLEATRIRRQGFPHRRPMEAFAARYADLLGSRDARRAVRSAALEPEDALAACEVICDAAIREGGVPEDELHIGHSKVFLRQTALEWLELTRQRVASTAICALVRGWAVRHRLEVLTYSAIAIQCLARRVAARGLLRQLRAEAAAAAEAARAEEELRLERERQERLAEEATALAEAERQRLALEQAVAEAAAAAAEREAAEAARHRAEAERKAAEEAWVHRQAVQMLAAARQEAAQRLEQEARQAQPRRGPTASEAKAAAAADAIEERGAGSGAAAAAGEEARGALAAQSACSTLQRWWRGRPAKASERRQQGRACLWDCLGDGEPAEDQLRSSARRHRETQPKPRVAKHEERQKPAAPRKVTVRPAHQPTAAMLRVATPARAASRRGAPPPTYAAANLKKGAAAAAALGADPQHDPTGPLSSAAASAVEEPATRPVEPRVARATAARPAAHTRDLGASYRSAADSLADSGVAVPRTNTWASTKSASVASSRFASSSVATTAATDALTGSRRGARSPQGLCGSAGAFAPAPRPSSQAPVSGGCGGAQAGDVPRVPSEAAARPWSEWPRGRAGASRSPSRPALGYHSPELPVSRARSPVIIRAAGSTAALRTRSFPPGSVYPASPPPGMVVAGAGSPQPCTWKVARKTVVVRAAPGCSSAGPRCLTPAPVGTVPVVQSQPSFRQGARSPARAAPAQVVQIRALSPGPVPCSGTAWVRVVSPLPGRAAPPMARLASPAPSFSGAGTPNAGGSRASASGTTTPSAAVLPAPWLLCGSWAAAQPGSPLAVEAQAGCAAARRRSSPPGRAAPHGVRVQPPPTLVPTVAPPR